MVESGVLVQSDSILLELSRKQSQLEALSRRFGVTRLELFGSALSARFSDSSDLDFLVWFADAPPAQRATDYFDLWFALEDLLQRRVDLVVAKAIINPFFECSTTQVIYAA